jgi:hypothetical protein
MPHTSSQFVTEAMLRDLVDAGVVGAVTATGKAGGFEVVVKFGNVERALGNARGAGKVFASLDTIAVQLLRLGIQEFAVKSAGYQPGRVRGPRPDRAEAMRRTAKQTANKRSSAKR